MLGVTLNADFLSRVLQHPAFARGETDTGFLERHRESLKPSPLTDAERRLLLAVAARAMHDPATRALALPHAAMGAWRN